MSNELETEKEELQRYAESLEIKLKDFQKEIIKLRNTLIERDKEIEELNGINYKQLASLRELSYKKLDVESELNVYKRAFREVCIDKSNIKYIEQSYLDKAREEYDC